VAQRPEKRKKELCPILGHFLSRPVLPGSEPEPLAFLVHTAVMTLFLDGEGYQIAHQQERDRREPAQDRHHYECIAAMHVFWVQRASPNLLAFKHEAFQQAEASDPDVLILSNLAQRIAPSMGKNPQKGNSSGYWFTHPGGFLIFSPDLGAFGPLFCERFPCASVKSVLAVPKILKG
jgi:hypothetical protein